MDVYELKYKLQKHNYTFYEHTHTKYCITKNEHGTYDEFYDFAIHIEVEPKTYCIVNWDVYIQKNDKTIEKDIYTLLNNSIHKHKTTFMEVCDILCK